MIDIQKAQEFLFYAAHGLMGSGVILLLTAYLSSNAPLAAISIGALLSGVSFFKLSQIGEN